MCCSGCWADTCLIVLTKLKHLGSSIPKELGRVCSQRAVQSSSGSAAQVEDFFTHLLQRVVPKHDTQARAEVTVTRRFLENFSADQVKPYLCYAWVWRASITTSKSIRLALLCGRGSWCDC